MKQKNKTTRKEKVSDKGQTSPNSKYGRKAKYLARHAKWGFEYAEPKPWKC